jgi:hypothetical protein
MPGTARVLFVAARRTSATVRDVTHHSEEYRQRLAALMRSLVEDLRDVDTQSSISLRSYQLRNTQGLPIGVVIGNADYARIRKDATRAADSSLLGYFRVPEPKDYNPYYDKPQTEWIPWRSPSSPSGPESPFGPDALQGHPPVLINLHNNVHDGFVTEIMTEPRRAVFGRTLPDTAYRKEYVDAEDLVERLRRDRYWQSALAAAHPKSGIWLRSCGVGQHEAQVIANAFKRTTHFSTGIIGSIPAGLLVDAVRDNSSVPFSVTYDVLRKFESSLDSAPAELSEVGEKYGWSSLVVFGNADSPVPLIRTVTPT